MNFNNDRRKNFSLILLSFIIGNSISMIITFFAPPNLHHGEHLLRLAFVIATNFLASICFHYKMNLIINQTSKTLPNSSVPIIPRGFVKITVICGYLISLILVLLQAIIIFN